MDTEICVLVIPEQGHRPVQHHQQGKTAVVNETCSKSPETFLSSVFLFGLIVILLPLHLVLLLLLGPQISLHTEKHSPWNVRLSPSHGRCRECRAKAKET